MSTFFAAFPDSNSGRLAVRHLLGDGIRPDDISLVTREEGTDQNGDLGSVGDASFVVGREDDPDRDDLVDQSSPIAEYEAAEESNIGGGIATDTRDDSVSGVEEMDDSQDAADDMIYPRDERSNSQHELDDLNLAVNTGFPTPVTPLDNASDAPQPTNLEADRTLDAVPIPGVGVVYGGGDLSTAAFDLASSNDGATLTTYLQDEGVPPGPANALLEQFENGGSLLAVALLPEVNQDALEEVAQRYGAVTSGWFGAPRY